MGVGGEVGEGLHPKLGVVLELLRDVLRRRAKRVGGKGGGMYDIPCFLTLDYLSCLLSEVMLQVFFVLVQCMLQCDGAVCVLQCVRCSVCVAVCALQCVLQCDAAVCALHCALQSVLQCVLQYDLPSLRDCITRCMGCVCVHVCVLCVRVYVCMYLRAYLRGGEYIILLSPLHEFLRADYKHTF